MYLFWFVNRKLLKFNPYSYATRIFPSTLSQKCVKLSKLCIAASCYSYENFVTAIFFNIVAAYRSFRDYGEAVLKHLETVTSSDPKLQKAPVNYEGVSVIFLVLVEYLLKIGVLPSLESYLTSACPA